MLSPPMPRKQNKKKKYGLKPSTRRHRSLARQKRDRKT